MYTKRVFRNQKVEKRLLVKLNNDKLYCIYLRTCRVGIEVGILGCFRRELYPTYHQIWIYTEAVVKLYIRVCN